MKRLSLALLLLAACAAPPPPMEPERSVAPTPVEAAAHPADSRVRVRLAAQEKRDRVRITGTPLGTLGFVREGDLVRSSEGRLASSFTVEALPRGEGLGLGGRIYPGVLVVAAHPSRGLSIENVVDLETYVAGVVPAELVLWSAEPAEIEAQAIAARTYALRGIRDSGPGAILWDDTRDQVYLGRHRPGASPAARRVAARFEAAVRRSAGLVLVGETGALYDVRFHASCGGHTSAPGDVFEREGCRGRASAPCPPCAEIAAAEVSVPGAERTRLRWCWTASEEELSRLARDLDVGRRVLGVRPVRVDPHGRWIAVEVEGDRSTRTIDLSRLRSELGPKRLRSGKILRTWPRPGSLVTGGLLFEGVGWGHGAGLCQNGSHELATRGWSSTAILAHYFPDARLAPLDLRRARGGLSG